MKRKILSWLLSLCMLLSLMPTTVFADEGTSAAAVVKNEKTGAEYTDIATAISKASVGDTLIILSDITNVAINVDKSVEITSTDKKTLDNVSITADGAEVELTVSNLKFTGTSYINANNAKALTVTDVEADVTLNKADTVTNSRAAFISLGASELNDQPLKVLINDNDIVVNGNNYPDPVLGWRYIADDSVISGNTFGSADAPNWEAVKLMNVMDGATITLEGNTAYVSGNGFAFGQNNSRDNSYSVEIRNNTFVGDGVDYVWVEVSKATVTNAKVNATSDNKVVVGDEERSLTADDLKTENTLKYYMGIDVVTDEDGKVIAGTLKAGSNKECIAEGCEFVKNEDGSYVVGTVSDITGSGTVEDPFVIDSLEGFKEFRDKVNAGNTYDKQYIKLTTDIDLANEEWTPIGYMGATFKGNFDGENNTISNLKITKTTDNTAKNNGIGLFGRTDSPAVIQNFTIENVDITGSLYVGAVVGLGYTGKAIENVTVKGNIAINAYWYAGVIGGNGYMNLVNNCHVIGNDGSYIKGNDGSYIGGIWGFRGEGNQKITNCTVTNIEITGVDRVGGISGIGHYGNTISDCTVKDVTINATDADATTVGIIAGACQGNTGSMTTYKNNVVENVIAKVGDKEITNIYGTKIDGTTAVTNYVAQVNSQNYETLADAAKAANAGDTIVLLADVSDAGNVTVKSGVTLDGNGYTISGNSAIYMSSTGTTVVKNINFNNIHNEKGNLSAIYATGLVGNADVTITGCAFDNVDWDALQITTKKDSTDTVKVTITGNTFEATDKTIDTQRYIHTQASGHESIDLTITGNKMYAGAISSISVYYFTEEGSTFNLNGNYVEDWESINIALRTDNTNDTVYLAGELIEYFANEELTEMIYPVAMVDVDSYNEDYYMSLEEAVKAAETGKTVTILENGTYTLPAFSKDITINASEDTEAIIDMTKAVALSGANVTFENITFKYADNATYTGLQHVNSVTYNNCIINGQVFLYGNTEIFNNCTFNQTDSNNYNVWTYGGKYVEFNDCTFNSAGKSVLVYNEGATATDLEVKNCEFIATEAVEGKAAIEIDTSLMPDGTEINITSSTATGFATGSISGNTLWNDKKDQTDLEVKVNGAKVWPLSADITYGAYNFSASGEGEKYRENFLIDVYNIVAEKSLELKLYSGETLVATTTLRETDRDDKTAIARPIIRDAVTVNVVVAGRLSGSWDTVWHEAPSIKYIPDKAEVYADGKLVETFEELFADEDKAAYIALPGVAKVASVTDASGNVSYYATLNEAFAAVEVAGKAGATITLLEDVTLTEGITVTNANVLSGVTLDGNGKTITANIEGTILRFGKEGNQWCTGVKIEDITIDGTATYALYLRGGTSSELTNVTITGDYDDVYGAVIFYGTHGATLTDCDIVSGFVNGQDNNPLKLVNSKIGTLLANSAENEGAKIFVNEESYIDTAIVAGDSTIMIDPASLEYIGSIVNYDGKDFVAEVAGVLYTNIQTAVDVAENGEAKTVTLLVDTSEDTILIPEDVILDLNGHKLTAKYVVAFDGASIIDSSEANSGLLIVAKNRLALDTDNEQLPIWNGEGYVFVERPEFMQVTQSEEVTKYLFRPSFDEYARNLLIPGKETSGITIGVHISWTVAGSTRTMDCVYEDVTVANVFNSLNNPDEPNRAFSLNLSNADELEDLTVSVIIKSEETGVIVQSDYFN